MKEKRPYLTRSSRNLPNSSKILKDNLNFKSLHPSELNKNKMRKRSNDLSYDSSFNCSDISLNHIKETIENVPPISSRLRSRTSFKVNGYHNNNQRIGNDEFSESSGSISEYFKTSTPNKKQKISKNNTPIISNPLTKSFSKTKPIFKTPVIQKPCRTRSLLKSVNNTENNTPARYLLRSRSFKAPSTPPATNTLETFFRTPEPPLKPLSEIYKKLTPVLVDKANRTSMSQLSDNSMNSSTCLSATLLSRFVKKNSKLPNSKSSKPWKQMRKIESSQEYNDSSSCTSIGEDSMSASVHQTDPEQKILDLCDQSEIKSWWIFFEDFSNKTTNKIGEGVYGEVFRLSRGNVLKVFPVDGDVLVNGEDQMTAEDVYPEVFVSKKLTELNGKNKLYRSANFVQLKKASLVRGKMPPNLIEQWKQFRNDKGSDNECLDFLSDKQKWMALEYEYAGEPLSNYKFNCYSEVRSIIEQISLSLAVAEAAMQFEHRDLHWLNILVKPIRQNKLRYRINGTNYSSCGCGIFVTIIDFTVSRMCVDNNTVYMDMSDCPEIFEGEGDYQFEIYRMMKKDNNNNWREFNARSNLYWVHYLIDKLLHETSYPRGHPDSKSIELELNQLSRRILSYKSAQQLIEKDVYFERCRVSTHGLSACDE